MKKVLIVNKFLYPNGGSETYIFQLGKELQRRGYAVQYFGMEDERNIVGNDMGSYTSNMNFHTGKMDKLLYPFKIIYSIEAKKALRKVLDDFQPDVVHLNNFNFQLTPSIIYEVKSYEKKADKKVKILFTAHDYQLVCPNHMMRSVKTNQNCSKCSNGNYLNCIKEKCIHGSTVKSVIGAVEGWVYRFLKAYQYIDTVICPSRFLQEKMEKHPYLKGKTIVMQNFSIVEDGKIGDDIQKEDYIVYFGRYSKEKGIETLLKVCEMLPEIPFVFAGNGPLEEQVNQVKNIENKGFLSGKDLEEVIRKARFSVYPSEWYENCPFSIMESIQYGTPVLGADIGGIPELIDEGETGELYTSGDEKELSNKIMQFWNDDEKLEIYSKECLKKKFMMLEEYVEWLLTIYTERV